MKPLSEKVGNVVVKIYVTTNAGYTEYKVVDYSTGKRRFHSFAEEREARDKAKAIAVALSRGEVNVLTLRGADLSVYTQALNHLRPLGIPLELAAHHFAEAVKVLGSDTVLDACRDYARRNLRKLPAKTVAEVAAEMVAAKMTDGASEIYLVQLKLMADKFADSFHCQIKEVDSNSVNEWLRSLKGTGRTRNNYRRSIGTLFRFAEASGYIPKGHLSIADLARAREAHTAVEIFTPQEMVKLLVAARVNPEKLPSGWNKRNAMGQGLLPYIILGAFSGLRTAEIQRQLWSDINIDRGFIRVTAAKGNTAQKRLVPISDNLREWLALCWKKEGSCCDYGRLRSAVWRLADRAGVKWKHNALRHSFISYRVALTQNIPQVSLEAGNSVQMINKHYREVVTPEEAATWFAIKPHNLDKIIPMPRAA